MMETSCCLGGPPALAPITYNCPFGWNISTHSYSTRYAVIIRHLLLYYDSSTQPWSSLVPGRSCPHTGSLFNSTKSKKLVLVLNTFSLTVPSCIGNHRLGAKVSLELKVTYLLVEKQVGRCTYFYVPTYLPKSRMKVPSVGTKVKKIIAIFTWSGALIASFVEDVLKRF